MEEQREVSILKSTFNYGVTLGLVFVIYQTIMWMLGLTIENITGYIGYLILIAGIVLATKAFRDNELGGFITYGKSLATGLLVSLFASIVLSVFIYVLHKFIDPGLVDKSLAEVSRRLYEGGFTEEQIDTAMQLQERVLTPFVIAIGQLFNTVFMGFLFSLITSIFLKKTKILQA